MPRVAVQTVEIGRARRDHPPRLRPFAKMAYQGAPRVPTYLRVTAPVTRCFAIAPLQVVAARIERITPSTASGRGSAGRHPVPAAETVGRGRPGHHADLAALGGLGPTRPVLAYRVAGTWAPAVWPAMMRRSAPVEA